MNSYTLFGIKILDIIYTNFIYIILAVVTGVSIDQFYGNFDEAKYAKSKLVFVLLEIIFHIILLSIVLFICRHLVMSIDSPFSYIKGYNHRDLQQLNSATIFTALLFVFQKNLIQKIVYFLKRLDGEFVVISNYT
jgi:predicted PurR-regulated permease PerM